MSTIYFKTTEELAAFIAAFLATKSTYLFDVTPASIAGAWVLKFNGGH